jgi:hypothetical protein
MTSTTKNTHINSCHGLIAPIAAPYTMQDRLGAAHKGQYGEQWPDNRNEYQARTRDLVLVPRATRVPGSYSQKVSIKSW